MQSSIESLLSMIVREMKILESTSGCRCAVFEEKGIDVGISMKNLILAQTAAFAFLIGDADACREKVQLSHLGGCQDSDGRMPESERHVPSNHILRRCGIG